jgi:hypothetical protein
MIDIAEMGASATQIATAPITIAHHLVQLSFVMLKEKVFMRRRMASAVTINLVRFNMLYWLNKA